MSFLRISAALAFALAIPAAPLSYAKAAINVYPLQATGYVPDSIVRAADGSVWFSAAELSPCHNNVTCQTEEFGSLHAARVREKRLGSTPVGATFGIAPGPAATLWITDALKSAYVFDLSGTRVATVDVSDGNGGGALSPPFIGPDGRMWFGQGSFGQGATGIVAIDLHYKIQPVATCSQCFFAGGIVAADGNAWLLDPYLGGFYRVTAGGTLTRFDYGKFVLQTIVAGPNAALWGIMNGAIAEYDTMGNEVASYKPPIAVQSGLQFVNGTLAWAKFGATKTGGNELDLVTMTAAGISTVHRYRGVGPCTSSAKQFFSTGPALGGDGALYVGIGCSQQSAPYTVGARSAVVRIAP